MTDQTGSTMMALSQCQSDIDNAILSLKKRFNELNRYEEERQQRQRPLQAEQSSDGFPDPARLIRRLTALEVSLSLLQKDCQSISEKRRKIVQSVVEKQTRNATRVEKLLSQTEGMERQSASNGQQQRTGDTQGGDVSEWNNLSRDLQYQSELLQTVSRKTV